MSEFKLAKVLRRLLPDVDIIGSPEGECARILFDDDDHLDVKIVGGEYRVSVYKPFIFNEERLGNLVKLLGGKARIRRKL